MRRSECSGRQPVADHGGGARAALLRRLKDHHRVAGKVAGLGEILRRAQQHRGVAVMAAGVHLARRLGGIVQPGLFLYRQRIHVGAQPDHLDLAAIRRPAALDHADHAGAAETGHHFVAAERLEPLGDEGRCPVDVVQQFGMGMEVAAPRHDFRLQIGDAIDDGHNSVLEGHLRDYRACLARYVPAAQSLRSWQGRCTAGRDNAMASQPGDKTLGGSGRE